MLQRFIECPECGERWIIEHDNGEWINADKCPKCGFPTMKPIIVAQGTTANRWPEELITNYTRYSNCNFDYSRLLLYKNFTDALLRRDKKPKNIPFKIKE